MLSRYLDRARGDGTTSGGNILTRRDPTAQPRDLSRFDLNFPRQHLRDDVLSRSSEFRREHERGKKFNNYRNPHGLWEIIC